MNWFVVRHPETKGVGIVAETALVVHKGLGWLRVSEAIPDHEKDQVVTADYADARDLDAEPSKPEPTSAKAAAKTSKES